MQKQSQTILRLQFDDIKDLSIESSTDYHVILQDV